MEGGKGSHVAGPCSHKTLKLETPDANLRVRIRRMENVSIVSLSGYWVIKVTKGHLL